MERTRTKLSKEEFERAGIPRNYVALGLLRVEKDATTKGGIHMGFLEDSTWEDESETHPADIASVIGRVIKVPQKLYYNENDPHNSMLWDTDMELEIGDLCWFSLMESLNANEMAIDGKIVRIIPYADCFVAKRSKWPTLNEDVWVRKHEVICLNGYVLLEQVPIPSVSELDQIDHGVYEDRGVVRYLGTPNRDYVDYKSSDDIVIKEGDLAYIKLGYRPFPLERRSYMAHFEGDKLFWCLQRRRIIAAI